MTCLYCCEVSTKDDGEKEKRKRGSRRSKLDLMEDVLTTLTRKPMTVSQLVIAVGLSYDRMKILLVHLEEKGFVGTVYSITKKGERIHTKYYMTTLGHEALCSISAITHIVDGLDLAKYKKDKE